MTSALKQILRRSLSSRPVRRRRRCELSAVDQLEVRVLPTAVVTFTGAALTITGDTGGNVVTVERVGTQLHVDGNGGFIRVLGTDVPEFFFNLTGSFNLNATFGDSGDILYVLGGLQLRSANIKMGDGGNIVDIEGATLSGKLTIASGDVGSIIDISTTSVTGDTLITTGASGDIVDIEDSRFYGKTTINTDGSGDIVDISGTAPLRTKFVGKLTINSGGGVADLGDIVDLEFIECKAISIDSGDGGDIVDLDDILVNGPFSVKSGAGGDIVIVGSVFQSGSAAATIDTGADGDILDMSLGLFAGPTTINLGTGGPGNIATIDDFTFNGTFTLNTQGTTDIIAIETDIGFAGATTFVKAAKFNLGPGNNVNLGVANAASNVQFLSSSRFTGKIPFSTLTVTVANVTFLSPPILTRVNRIDV